MTVNDIKEKKKGKQVFLVLPLIAKVKIYLSLLEY